MLQKRGKSYSARFQIAGRDTNIPLYQTSKRDAQRAHDIIDHELKSKRIARTLCNLILEQAKAMARKEITAEQVISPLAAIEGLAKHAAMDIIEKMLPAPPLTAAIIWQRYLGSSAAKALKPSTLDSKRGHLAAFIGWAGDRDCTRFGSRDAALFLASLTCGNTTKRRYVATLSSVWELSPELHNPWSMSLCDPERNEHKQALSLDQIRQLVDSLAGDPVWRVATKLGYYTGLRLTDVVHLERSQVVDGWIDLTPRKTDNAVRDGKRVRIPLPSDLQQELDALPMTIGQFFPDLAARYDKDRTAVNRRFLKKLAAVGITAKGYGFHSLRHSFVTEALKAGVALKTVQAVAGQVDEATTNIYYHGERNADLSALPAI